MIVALRSSFDSRRWSRTYSTLFRLYDSERVNVSRVEFTYDSHQIFWSLSKLSCETGILRCADC